MSVSWEKVYARKKYLPTKKGAALPPGPKGPGFRAVNRMKKNLIFLIFLSTFFSVCFFYFFKHKREEYIEIPVLFRRNGNPCLKANIEGIDYLFAIDTGSDSICSIRKQTIDQIQKKKKCNGNWEWNDIKGNHYISSLFKLDLIRIGKLSISDVTVFEENADFLSNGCIIKASENPNPPDDLVAGRVGSRAFRYIDYWLIDFQNSRIVASKSLEKLKEIAHIQTDNFTEVDIEEIFPFIVFQVDTSLGLRRLVLDTGASHTVLKTPSNSEGNHTITSNKFIIGGHDFGPKECYLFNVSGTFDAFDGFIGREFLRKHSICFDFKNRKAYIYPFHLKLTQENRI